MPNWVRIIGTMALLFLTALTGFAQESITSFDVDIIAEQNGDLRITETITINVEGRQVKRGILRELPRFQLYQGKKIPIRYEERSVDRNDSREPFVIEKNGNAYVLRIGDADVYLQHESHKYEISYLIKDELRRTDSFDEIFWNVTGNEWRLPIDSASARITVPDTARFQSVDFFTGRLGEKGKEAEFQKDDGLYTFQTTNPLSLKEGLTIILRFDKGVFGDVQDSTKRYIFKLRYGALLLLSLSFLGIAGYYYRSWNKVGRDPAKGPVFARYQPPEGYSAAAAGYIYYRGVKDYQALIATLMGLANKQWISIETRKKQTTLTPLERELLYEKDRLAETPNEFMPLNPEETELFGLLFPPQRVVPITLNNQENADFYQSQAAFHSHLQREFGKEYHRINIGYIMLGIFASIAAAVISISQMSSLTPKWLFALIAALIILNILFIYLMPAPTKKGQEIRTNIEGFRLYMKTAEEQKLDSVEVGSDRPPPMSVDRYEQLLPYAIALGVEDPWNKYFEKIMPVEAKNYEPHWGGTGRNFRSIRDATDHMVSNISSGVSSSAPRSSSSSGGSGGGFSGGGGGGGGGGGW